MRLTSLGILAVVACGSGSGSGSAPAPVPEPIEVNLEKAREAPPGKQETLAREPTAGQHETLDACLAREIDGAIDREPDPTAASTYARARSAERAGRLDEARKAYFELIQRHPKSPLVPFAYWAFGELFRDESKADPTKLAFARQSYEEVLKFPASGLDRAAHGRLIEVLARMGEPERAMNAVAKSIGRPVEQDRSLCGELVRAGAIDHLVALYPGFGSAAKAHGFVRRLAKDDDETVIVMIRLAETYASRGSKDEALDALAPALAQGAALPPAACLRASNVIEAAAGAKSAGDTRATLNRACQGH